MSPRYKAGRAYDAMFGNNMRELRVLKGMSEDALGLEIGVNQQQVSRYETGGTPFPISRLPALCSALNVRVTELFRGFFDQADEGPDEPDLWAMRMSRQLNALPKSRRPAVSRIINELTASEIVEPNEGGH